MSGGAFDYKQYTINEIVDEIERIIANNKVKDNFGYCLGVSNKTLKEFKKGIKYLKLASIYAQRIDWLVSGDDSEETFHKRLKEDKEKS